MLGIGDGVRGAAFAACWLPVPDCDESLAMLDDPAPGGVKGFLVGGRIVETGDVLGQLKKTPIGGEVRPGMVLS